MSLKPVLPGGFVLVPTAPAGSSFVATNVVRVDQPNGNDSTGAVGNLNKPFQTVAAALTALEAISLTDPFTIIITGPSFHFEEDLVTALANITFVSNGRINCRAYNSLTLTNTSQPLFVSAINIELLDITASSTHELFVDLRHGGALNGTVANTGNISVYGPMASGNTIPNNITINAGGVVVENFPSQRDEIDINTTGNVSAFLSLLNNVTAVNVSLQDARFKPGGALSISGTITYINALLGVIPITPLPAAPTDIDGIIQTAANEGLWQQP